MKNRIVNDSHISPSIVYNSNTLDATYPPIRRGLVKLIIKPLTTHCYTNTERMSRGLLIKMAEPVKAVLASSHDHINIKTKLQSDYL